MAYKKKPDGIYSCSTRGRAMIHNGYAKSIYWNKQMIDDIQQRVERDVYLPEGYRKNSDREAIVSNPRRYQ